MPTGKSEVKPTAAVVLDTRRQKVNGTFPIRLRITYQRERKYYSIRLDDLTSEEWYKLRKAERLKDKRLVAMRDEIAEYEKLAKDIIKEIPRFSFERFEERYFADHSIDAKSRADDVYMAFTDEIAKLRGQGRVSTASTYETALNSLKNYRSRLRFTDLTPKLLEEYENRLVHEGRSITTVGIYLRNLRTLVNQAKAKGVITAAEYPFGKGRYEIPAARNVKKALTLSEIERIYNSPTVPESPADRAKDLWFFSYLCNGINVKDICRLRWANVDQDRITFVRAKTARTRKSNQKPISIIVTKEVRAIIEKWADKDHSSNGYVFPFLPANVTPQRERELVQYLTRSINKYVKRIAVELGIDKPVTTYTARHSYSTVLKRSGAPIEFISESLGHSDLRTTENYLDSFEDDTKRQYIKSLLNFNYSTD
ncbi:Tyrosine recombinase xerD [Fibrisoma limi BUZ 3]|uniref:Tyrosine recombinase xerD n=1 Tax=Fibrisoma limi BUZ 3 TaxID=1185876 RepID=I2GCF2_9BACT|nr:site-specific integrase [Fibrisoma limi]CCH51576.1 Tyrosine recombinase xerD [Fibrisoma limi BUZ 3]